MKRSIILLALALASQTAGAEGGTPNSFLSVWLNRHPWNGTWVGELGDGLFRVMIANDRVMHVFGNGDLGNVVASTFTDKTSGVMWSGQLTFEKAKASMVSYGESQAHLNIKASDGRELHVLLSLQK